MDSNSEIISDIAYCTIVTKSHLAYARALAYSIEAYNPQSKLFVLLADMNEECIDIANEPFELIELEELNDQEDIQKMCFYYTPSELCFCLRAWLHEYMFHKTPFAKWIYFDSDIMVYHSLKEISDQLDEISILLSPHLISIDPPPSIDVKEIRRLESYLLRNGGIYNGGFLALRETEESEIFIKWFKDHLRWYGFDNRPMQSGDQFWITCVPLYFREVGVLRHPGANLAYWNLYERNIEKDSSGKITVDEQSLIFYHFAGFDMESPQKVTKYPHPPSLLVIPPPIKDIAREYHRLLIENRHEEAKNYSYAFAKFQNGKSITPMMRRLYFDMVFHNAEPTESPFEKYEYFQSLLRSQRIKNIIRNGGKYLVTQIKRTLKPDYYFDKP
jgi:hypothetical protein